MQTFIQFIMKRRIAKIRTQTLECQILINCCYSIYLGPPWGGGRVSTLGPPWGSGQFQFLDRHGGGDWVSTSKFDLFKFHINCAYPSLIRNEIFWHGCKIAISFTKWFPCFHSWNHNSELVHKFENWIIQLVGTTLLAVATTLLMLLCQLSEGLSPRYKMTHSRTQTHICIPPSWTITNPGGSLGTLEIPENS